ncbi:MAG: hypothetical protein Q8P50_12570 [Bacillota bacterium]|nr:hypothetical protein [Bacillota bacterium]
MTADSFMSPISSRNPPALLREFARIHRGHTKRPASLKGALLLSLACVAANEAPGPAVAQVALLQLAEVATWQPPEGFRLEGVSQSRTGELLVWSRRAAIVLSRHWEQQREVRFPENLSVVSAALVRGGAQAEVEVLAQEPLALYRLAVDGSIRESTRLRVAGRLARATWSPEGWLLLLERSEEDPATFALVRCLGRDGGELRQIATLEADSYLANAPGLIVLSRISEPYTVHVLHEAGGRQRMEPPVDVLDSLMAAQERGTRDGWAALSTIPINDGFMQVISDLTSDLRILVLYDALGRFSRARTLDAPLAFLASDLEEETLIAVRRVNQLELVRYTFGRRNH